MASVIGERAQINLRDFAENRQIFVAGKTEYLEKKPLYEIRKRLFDVVAVFQKAI